MNGRDTYPATVAGVLRENMGHSGGSKGPMPPSLDIARRLQTQDFSPFEFSKTFGTSLESATRIVKAVGTYYGPNGKGEQAFAKLIRHTLNVL